MNWKVVLSERALAELVESWEWYEDRLPGLGDRFKTTIFENLQQLEDNPDKGVKRNPVYRELIVKTFPFLIIYRIEKAARRVFVQSIFHMSRDPRKKYHA